MKFDARKLYLLIPFVTLALGIGTLRLHQPGHLKDGDIAVGAGAGTVPFKAPRNQVQWRSGAAVFHWVGQAAEDPESVYFDGSRVYPFSWSRAMSLKGFVIRFRPNKVEVIDLGHFAGAYYLHRKN